MYSPAVGGPSLGGGGEGGGGGLALVVEEGALGAPGADSPRDGSDAPLASLLDHVRVAPRCSGASFIFYAKD
jgi:hypothetical protein